MEFTPLYTQDQQLNRIQELVKKTFDTLPSVVFQPGDIKSSILTVSQFKSVNGPGWALCDGRDISGTTLSRVSGLKNLPDLRNKFIRMSATGQVTGTIQSDATAVNGLSAVTASDGSHSHLIDATSSGVHQPNSSHFVDGQPGSQDGSTQAAGVHTHAITVSSTDTETRPANVSVNFFIKVD